MVRCVHLHDDGVQCVSDAVESRDFCQDHQQSDTEEIPSHHPLRKLLLRLVAAILLLILLIPFYRAVRVLSFVPAAESGEGG